MFGDHRPKCDSLRVFAVTGRAQGRAHMTSAYDGKQSGLHRIHGKSRFVVSWSGHTDQ